MTLQVTILAAGMGTRLGRPWPKPLTPLADGRSIMAQQMDNVRAAFGDEASLVVAFLIASCCLLGADRSGLPES